MVRLPATVGSYVSLRVYFLERNITGIKKGTLPENVFMKQEQKNHEIKKSHISTASPQALMQRKDN